MTKYVTTVFIVHVGGIRLCNLEDQITQQTGWGVELIRAKKNSSFSLMY
jgi:hypothetical protein